MTEATLTPWTCACDAPANLHPADQAACETCGYISQAEYDRRVAAAQVEAAPAPALDAEKASRLVGLAGWLDSHLAERISAGQVDLDPTLMAGVAAIIRGMRRDPARTYAQVGRFGALLDTVRGWVDRGEQIDPAAVDQFLGGSE